MPAIIAAVVNFIIKSTRLAVVKKYNSEYKTIDKILAETHPTFYLVSALLTAVCPIAIIVIAVQNFIGLL